MRAGVVLLVSGLLLSSCVRGEAREDWLRDVKVRSESLCTWTGARWEDRAPLLFTGSEARLGRARVVWDGERWAGANVTGALRQAGPVLLFDGQWAGDGFTLEATVDVSEHAVFRAHGPTRLGTAGLVLPGASVRLVLAQVGRVLAQPADAALQLFSPRTPPVFELACDGLTLHGARGPADDERRALAQAGFSAEAPERWLPEGTSIVATQAAGGVAIGRFEAERGALRGFVVAEQGTEARLAVPSPAGVLWVGWVPAAALQAGPTLAEGPRVLSPQPEPAPPPSGEWLACPFEDVVVSAQVGGELRRVGVLARGAPFLPGAATEEGLEVRLAVPWLELEPSLVLVAPASAARCPKAKHPP